MTPLALFGVAVAGLMIGSFLNVCIGRIPAGESIVSPGSRCPGCRLPIAWYDNLPIVSFVMLGGRCRRCRTSISIRYPVIEACTALAFLGQAVMIGSDIPLLLIRLALTGLLIVLFGTDLETERLPNVLTLPGLALGLCAAVWLPPGLASGLIGAALGGGLLWLIRWGWKRATGVDGMGLGDVKMLAMIGAFLGWQDVFVVLFLASLSGAIVGIFLAAIKARTLQTRLPFGTFLAVAAYVASLVGDPLVRWYASLY